MQNYALKTPKAVKHEGGIFLKNFPGLIYTKNDEESEKNSCETIGCRQFLKTNAMTREGFAWPKVHWHYAGILGTIVVPLDAREQLLCMHDFFHMSSLQLLQVLRLENFFLWRNRLWEIGRMRSVNAKTSTCNGGSCEIVLGIEDDF